jgi:hypothetical protein
MSVIYKMLDAFPSYFIYDNVFTLTWILTELTNLMSCFRLFEWTYLHQKNKNDLFAITFKHPVALIYHLFHTIYFCLQCNLLLSPFPLTTCFGHTWSSSGVSNSLKLVWLDIPYSAIISVNLTHLMMTMYGWNMLWEGRGAIITCIVDGNILYEINDYLFANHFIAGTAGCGKYNKI